MILKHVSSPLGLKNLETSAGVPGTRIHSRSTGARYENAAWPIVHAQWGWASWSLVQSKELIVPSPAEESVVCLRLCRERRDMEEGVCRWWNSGLLFFLHSWLLCGYSPFISQTLNKRSPYPWGESEVEMRSNLELIGGDKGPVCLNCLWLEGLSHLHFLAVPPISHFAFVGKRMFPRKAYLAFVWFGTFQNRPENFDSTGRSWFERFSSHDSWLTNKEKRYQCPPLADVTFFFFFFLTKVEEERKDPGRQLVLRSTMDQGCELLTVRLTIIPTEQDLASTILVCCCFKCEFYILLAPPNPRQSYDWEWAEAFDGARGSKPHHLHASASLSIFPPVVCLGWPLVHVSLSQHALGSYSLCMSAKDKLVVHYPERR